MHYQIHSTREFLEAAEERTEEVERLLAVVRAADAGQDATQVEGQVGELLSYAEWLEGELRFAEAADVLATTLRIIGGRDARLTIAAHLQLARVLRLLGRFDEAQNYYRRGGELARTEGDAHAELLSRIGRAIVLQKTGNLPESERMLREVLRAAAATGDRDAEARACHDLAVCLFHMNRGAEGAPWAFRAFQLYESPMHQLRALSDTGQILKERGHYAAARGAFQTVLDREPTREVRLRTLVELMDLSSLTGDRISFERWRREIKGNLERLPPDEQVDFEVKLGLGLMRFGGTADAEAHLRRAIALSEQHTLPEWLFRAEAALKEIEGGRVEPPSDSAASTLSPELRSTIESLEQLCHP